MYRVVVYRIVVDRNEWCCRSFFFFLAFCKTINDQGTLIGLKILSRLIEV